METKLLEVIMSRLFVVFVDSNQTPLDQLVVSFSGQVQRVGELLIEKRIGDFTHVSVSPPSSPRSLSPIRCHLPLYDSSPLEEDNDLASIIVISAEHSFIPIKLDSTAASAFSHLMCTSECYNRQLQRNWTMKGNDTLVHVSVTPCLRHYLDYGGNHIARNLIIQFVEMDDALNWLSTLGGAYSNLGEHNQNFAKRAEINARRQLKVASKAGDLFSLTKCWLFIAMSQMQQGHLLQSRKILRIVYKFCGSKKIAIFSGSSKLRTMCRGIWSRLRHSWDQKYQTIEVETKFQVADDYASAIINIGGRLDKKIEMVDIYYDTESFDLMKKDHWLRLRNGAWELKYPPVDEAGHCGGLTAYRECCDPSVIVDTVSCLLPQHDVVAQDNMENLVSRLTVLAELTTERECWKLLNVQVVVDTVKHQDQVLTQVGEVEMVVGATNQLDFAREKVKEVAQALGVANYQPEGKLAVYLRKMKPDSAVILDELMERKRVGDQSGPVTS